MISSVSRYSTTKRRSRNKRKEEMNDERGRWYREEMKKGSTGLWEKGAVSNEGL